jgi:hypothetical protein
MGALSVQPGVWADAVTAKKRKKKWNHRATEGTEKGFNF